MRSEIERLLFAEPDKVEQMMQIVYKVARKAWDEGRHSGKDEVNPYD